ncbi:MAG TPA: hypothetical protein VMV49_18675 [Candidatus Deferrimicrobium sp.]|nr:hypothetical protein [Candidatus Deferrimicrobium sp.]
MAILTTQQLTSLEKAGLKKDQINIIVHNLEDLVKSRKISTSTVEIIVHNIVKDTTFRQRFFKNPKETIMSANPQPSP